MKQFIKEAKERNKNDVDVLNVIDEMEAETSRDSRILGTLLTTALCFNQGSEHIRNRYTNGYYVGNR